ncbi:hypothetical protein Rmf_15050 [Roseomonas fluvialis]|uniref:Type II toxin-antitoxin system ParD family antitoxin n=1 Tax=Roseomonas fluvialis TaxID=1750527 RepID=A0ABM7Y1D3_9PROT|nr:hypothetical protein Rmf_15050 [Roseomonas fluvialis]
MDSAVIEMARRRRPGRADTGARRDHGASNLDNGGLIRPEQEIERLRCLLREGAASAPAVRADEAYFTVLRDRLRQPPPA